MPYQPPNNEHKKKAYIEGYTDAQYLGKNYNPYSPSREPHCYDAYVDGFRDWFDSDDLEDK